MNENDDDSVKSLDSETQDIMDQYSQGKKFPQFHEIKGIITLLDVIIDKYKFIHPQDQNIHKINNFVLTNSVIANCYENVFMYGEKNV